MVIIEVKSRFNQIVMANKVRDLKIRLSTPTRATW